MATPAVQLLHITDFHVFNQLSTVTLTQMPLQLTWRLNTSFSAQLAE